LHRKERCMKFHAFVTTIAAVVACAAIADAQRASTIAEAAPSTVEGLVSAAKVAAGTDWSGTFTRLCIPPPAEGRGRGAAPGGAAARGRGNTTPAATPATPPRERWHAEPAKVADNFYFIGEKDHSSWALVGSQG